jgi:hypothetical protein
MINQNQRYNFVHTSNLLHEARALLTAIELAEENVMPRDKLDQCAQAIPKLIQMLEIKLIEIEKNRSIEWVGMDSKSIGLTDHEIKQARSG